MEDEIDFEHIATVFGVLMEAHSHGSMFVNIYKAALKELAAIEESLAPVPKINITPTSAATSADETDEDDDDE